MKRQIAIIVALMCFIPAFLQAAEVKLNVDFKWGDPVLRNDSMGMIFKFSTNEEAQKFSDECQEDFNAVRGKAKALRQLMYDLMKHLNYPEGFLANRYYIQLNGREVWGQKLKDYWFMRMIEKDEKGNYGNYYNCVVGLRLIQSTKEIVSFVKPAKNWLNIGGPTWVPPDYYKTKSLQTLQH